MELAIDDMELTVKELKSARRSGMIQLEIHTAAIDKFERMIIIKKHDKKKHDKKKTKDAGVQVGQVAKKGPRD